MEGKGVEGLRKSQSEKKQDDDTGTEEGKDRNRERHRSNRDRGRRRGRGEVEEDPVKSFKGPIMLLKRAELSQSSQGQTTSSQPMDDVSQSKDKDETFERTPRKMTLLNRESEGTSGATSKSIKTSQASATSSSVQLLRNPLSKTLSDSSTNLSKKVVDTEVPKPKPKLTPVQAAKLSLKLFDMNRETFLPVIDQQMNIHPGSEISYFRDKGRLSSDYFVITALGRPLTGKSSILTYLAGEDANGKMFPTRQRDQQLESYMYITNSNLIFIEMASLFNCSAVHDLANQQGNLETLSMAWNLRLMRWALSISHIVLIISDNLFEPNLCQLMSSAEMIRPMTSALGEGVQPEIGYICNKVPSSLLDDPKMENKYQLMFDTIAGRCRQIKQNFFMLPLLRANMTISLDRIEDFRASLREFIACNRCPHYSFPEGQTKFPQNYNASEWYCNAVKIWEEMQHSGYFSSYVKLLP